MNKLTYVYVLFIDVLLDNSMSTRYKSWTSFWMMRLTVLMMVFNNSILSKQYATESTKLTSTKYIDADLNLWLIERFVYLSLFLWIFFSVYSHKSTFILNENVTI